MAGFMGLAITRIRGGECVSASEEIIHARHPQRLEIDQVACVLLTDHFSCRLATRTSCLAITLRSISSSRAGVPRRRTHTMGYCSTGKAKSNFRSNHAGTLLDSGDGTLRSIGLADHLDHPCDLPVGDRRTLRPPLLAQDLG